MAAATAARCSKARSASRRSARARRRLTSTPIHALSPPSASSCDFERRLPDMKTFPVACGAGDFCAGLPPASPIGAEPRSGAARRRAPSLRTMEQVAIAAHKCWFASKDPAFRAYRMANELNSFSGTPRFLLVPAKNYGGKPLLVVQAQGHSPRVEVFGPLMGEPLGARIGSPTSTAGCGSALSRRPAVGDRADARREACRSKISR